jgi:hypothetical protein
VTALRLEAPGLAAEGTVTVSDDGGLGLARLSRLRVGQWLDAAVELRGQGRGGTPVVAVTGGSADLRRLPERRGGAGGAAGPMTVALDRLTVTEGIALTAFGGELIPGAATTGSFRARVNGGPEVAGRLSPAPEGTAIRLQAGDAGAVLRAAGLFEAARGGSLDLTLTPRGAPGAYDGGIRIRDVRVRNSNLLAALLNAASVVGLLEQMTGDGILFSDVKADLRLTPQAVEIRRGAATGASLGLSLEGLVETEGRRLDLQGVLSPVYLLNGIGSGLTRKGEGFFGVNYTVRGTADRPSIGVNPLSILTPGMFREIFRGPPPRIGGRGP